MTEELGHWVPTPNLRAKQGMDQKALSNAAPPKVLNLLCTYNPRSRRIIDRWLAYGVYYPKPKANDSNYSGDYGELTYRLYE